MDVDARIEQLSALRQELWREGADPAEVAWVSEQLKAAYAERRATQAERLHGDPTEIIRRARIESELERLMAED